MSLTRRQIGAAWTFQQLSGSTTIPLPARTIQRGSLVKAVFRYEAANVALTVTDSAGGVWKVERHFQSNVNVAIAWSWNHPGGSNVVITGNLASSQSYRDGYAWEETGGDVCDPAIPESVIKTWGNATTGLAHWVGSDPLADTVHASGSYSSVTTITTGQSLIASSSYSVASCIRGQNLSRRFARHSFSGSGSSIAHVSMAFRAPEAEYVALAKRRIWIPVSAGGGGASQSIAFTLDGISAAVAQVTGRTQSVSASLDGITFAALQVAGHSQTLSATLDDLTFSAIQSLGGANSQSLAITLDGVQASASQTLGHSQSATVALDGVSFASSQTLGHAQSVTALLADLAFSATQSASSPTKQQSLAVTLDDVEFSASQEGPAVAQSHGFVLVDFEPKLWWKRKPKALDDQEAAEKIAAVARQIERVAIKQVKAGRVVQPTISKPAKAEILQAIAPQLRQMPGFDPVELYRSILERLIQQEQQRQAEIQAQQIAAQEIERIRLMELDEDETIILLMGA